MNQNILILSRGFRAGDAITTLNLFSQWHKENLYCASLVDSEYTGEFNDFYLLGDKEICYSFPFNYFSRPKPSRVGSMGLQSDNSDITPSRKKKIYQKWIRPVLQWLDLYESRTKISVSDEFSTWIKKIRPVAIYTSIGDISMAKFVLKIHECFPEIKIIVHGFDDWLSPTYKIWNDSLHRRSADRLFHEILNFADGRFTSSDKMAADYKKKYNYEFTCFPNPVKIPEWRTDVVKSSVPNIVFTGKVGWHNAEALKEMINVVDEINRDGRLIRFDIYTSTSQSQCNLLLGRIPTSTHFKAPVHHKDIPHILASAHILFLPISLDSQTSKFTRYSMSTKMGEYLSSEVPVIYIGPEGIAMTEFLKEKACAYCITKKDSDILKETIFKCLSIKNDEMLKRGRSTAVAYFNKDTISNSFAHTLRQIIYKQL